jgi:ubiquinone biosynthesis protein UbiJ
MATGFLGPFERILNRNIADSARARALLAELQGRSLELRFAATPLRIRLAAAPETLTVSPAGDEPADAVIEGTPLSFLRLAAGDAAKSVRAGGMDVQGDAEVAEGFRRLLEAAKPDFEEELSRFAGDAAAHHLARAARGTVEFGRRAGDAFARNLAEYLSEESRDVPVRLEAEEFVAAVDRLRESVDRLEARVAAAERTGSAR